MNSPLPKKWCLILLGISLSLGVSSCSLFSSGSVQKDNFKLEAVSTRQFAKGHSAKSIVVSQPSAAAGYEDTSMQYMQQNYKIGTFAKNEWLAPPAEMLQPLLVQSLKNTGYFRAVTPAPFAGITNLRLDTQLVKLQQNFVTKPSHIEFVIQATLVNAHKSTLIASQRFTAQVNAPADNPYGGVIAANIACQQLMEQIAAFTVRASSA